MDFLTIVAGVADSFFTGQQRAHERDIAQTQLDAQRVAMEQQVLADRAAQQQAAQRQQQMVQTVLLVGGVGVAGLVAWQLLT